MLAERAKINQLPHFMQVEFLSEDAAYFANDKKMNCCRPILVAAGFPGTESTRHTKRASYGHGDFPLKIFRLNTRRVRRERFLHWASVGRSFFAAGYFQYPETRREEKNGSNEFWTRTIQFLVHERNDRLRNVSGLLRRLKFGGALSLIAALFLVSPSRAQDRIKATPEYARYVKVGQEIFRASTSGEVSVTWQDDGKSFEYFRAGKRYRYDIAAGRPVEIKGVEPAPTRRGQRGGRGGSGMPGRGRQIASVISPDGKRRAFYRERNLWISDAAGANETQITTDGSEKTRLKYATASWVYGEELDQITAIWWSPDSRKVAFYRFDESKVKDYYVAEHQMEIQDTLSVEPFPTAGAPNPVADICLYDVETKKTLTADARDGKPFDDAVVGHYVYGVEWTPDGRELLFHRANRLQNVMEIAACDPQTGKCRVVVREAWPASWTENRPEMRFLKDGMRFILASERTGWRNFYLYDLSGKLIAPLTNHTFEVASIERVDEERGLLYYMARDGDNPMKLQLHRVGLDGRNDVRLTDPAFLHRVDIAPDGQHFIDIAQTHDTPPETRLLDADGKILATLAQGNTDKYIALGLQKTELFTFKAADGQTPLYGMLYKPSHFDPQKKYPLLVTVYAGPDTAGAQESFAYPNALTELGFLVASFDSRSAGGRGKRSLDAIYKKLGLVEIDDQAAGVKYLRQRPYVDGGRVGVFGTSYGGYAAAMCLLRYPDVFQAASASSAVTDWRNYDSIYTERYMGLPQDNAAAYDAGSAMTYAKDLKGSLMIYFGTADDNVHPSQSLQLIAALQREGKSFEAQLGPDKGHTSLPMLRMMEFFIESFQRDSPRASLSQ